MYDFKFNIILYVKLNSVWIVYVGVKLMVRYWLFMICIKIIKKSYLWDWY